MTAFNSVLQSLRSTHLLALVVAFIVAAFIFVDAKVTKQTRKPNDYVKAIIASTALYALVAYAYTMPSTVEPMMMGQAPF